MAGMEEGPSKKREGYGMSDKTVCGMKIVLSALAFLWTASAFADPPIPSQVVYPGCEQPPTTANHFWYFDPAHGDDVSGDGSAAKPWKTLEALFLAVKGNSNT